MRLLLSVALVLSVAGEATAAHGDRPGGVDSFLLGMADHGVSTASMVPAGGSDYDALWAAWGADDATPRTVRLVLVRRAGNKSRVAWTVRRAGYAPTLVAVGEWRFGARGVLLLRYQVGAASVRAEAYGLDAQSKPVMLERIEGSVIELATVDGATVVKTYEGADLQTPPACFGWNSDARGLQKVSCTPAPP